MAMEARTLGRTGLGVSPIGFGGAPLGLANYLSAYDPRSGGQRAAALEAIVRALEVGLTYFDTALAYGDGESERILGEARREALKRGMDVEGETRMVLATKVPGSRRTYEGVMESAAESRKNLGVERIDVLQLHGSAWQDDEAEAALAGGALEALRELKRRGEVGWIGFTSETCSPGTYRLVRSGEFDVLQMAYSILYQDACNLMVKAGPIVEAKERGMGVVTMRSLTSGVFQKLMGRGEDGREGGGDGGSEGERRAYEMALKYVLSNGYVDCALVGMRTRGEVERNAAIAGDRAARYDLEELHRRYV